MKRNPTRSFILFVSFAFIVFSQSATRGDDSPRKITVSGTAVSKVVPDTIIWTLNVVSTHEELSKACQSNEETVASLIQFHKKELGSVTDSEIQTGYLNIRKVFDQNRNQNQPTFRHFEVTRAVTLCQRDVSKFDKVFRTLSQRPDVQSSYRLESSQYTKTRRETRLEAAKMAKTKAAEMTEVLDSKLGKVLEISENAEARSFGYASNSIRNVEFAADTSADTVSGSFAPGTIEVKVSVLVAFEIE